MEDTKTIFAHIGLHKAASTFLQRNVFPSFQGIHFVKKSNWCSKKQIVDSSKENKFLFSNECEVSRDPRVQNLYKDFPDVNVILVLRKQENWIPSKYKYYIRKSGYKGFREYFDIQNDTGIVKKENFRLMDYVSRVEKYFGKPFIIFQEELRTKPFEAIDEIAAYMNVDYDRSKISLDSVNGAFSTSQLIVLRKFNTLFRGRFSKPFKLFKIKIKYRDLLNHVVVNTAGRAAEVFSPSKEPLIPKQDIESIRNEYREDIEACMKYASGSRRLLFD